MVRSATIVVDSLILRPIQGALDICTGIALMAPVLLRATSEAVRDLIEQRLTRQGKARIHQGIEKVVAGAWLLSAPAALALLILACRAPLGFWFLMLGAWGFMLSVDAEELWRRCTVEWRVRSSKPVGVAC